MVFFETAYSFLKDEKYRELLFTTLLLLAFGSAVYHYLEGWSWVDSVYFSIITLTTVGYGDFSPQTDAGKLFTIFYIIVGIGIILSFINTLYFHYDRVNTISKRKKKRKKIQNLNPKDQLDEID